MAQLVTMKREPSPPLAEFEEALLDALLAGDHPVLATLREQRAGAACVSRELSGVGFFLEFSVPDAVALVAPEKFVLGDVLFNLQGPDHGGGAILFVRGGKVEMLEAYCFEDDWPSEISRFSISYDGGPQRDVARIMSAALSRAS